MTDKVTLATISTFVNDTTAATTFNNNMAAITTAMDNTLSRDGTSPNMMSAALDMNSNQILNLPSPATMNSPARLVDVASNPTINVPPIGTSGAVVGLLNANKTDSGNNTFTGTNTFSNGIASTSLTNLQTGTGSTSRTVQNKFTEIVSVLDFGADPTGIANSSTAFQNAVNSLSASSGGIVHVPKGYYFVNNLTLNTNVILQGDGRTTTYLWSGYNDATIVTLGSGGQNFIFDMAIFGKGSTFVVPGIGLDTTTFVKPVNDAVVMNSSGGGIARTQIFGGLRALLITATDATFFDTIIDQAYGQASVVIQGLGQSWFIRNKWDHATTATSAPPYGNWAATTAYVVGQSVNNGLYSMVCTVAGTSGGSAPTLKYYSNNITDGTVTWQLLQLASNYSSLIVLGNAGENHFIQCDFSGNWSPNNSISINSTPAPGAFPVFIFTDCTISSGLTILSGDLLMLRGNELDGTIVLSSGYTGATTICDNFWVGSGGGVSVAANVGNFIVSNNLFNSGTVSVAAGTSNNYIISNNTGVTITDAGTGNAAFVHSNPGYNPVGVSAPVTMGASPFTYTAGHSPETHYVNQSATNTATMAKGSRAIGTLAGATTYYTVQLGPNESYTTTWATTAPTYTKDVH